MVKKSSMKKKFIICMTVVMLVVAMAAVTALADAENPEVTIAGGTLSGGDLTFTDFTDITLNGHAQTTDATWSIAGITDARGTGDGWRLSFSLSLFREYDDVVLMDYVPGGRIILPGSVTVFTAPVVNLADVTSSPVGTITAVSAGTALDSGPMVNLLSAEVNGGMGSYTIGPMVARLTVRADAYAANYKADAIISLVTGP